MDVEITKMDGTRTKLSDIGVEARDFIVSSIELNPIYTAIEGRHGHVNMGATYGTRTITVPFYFKAGDLHGVALSRDELFGLVTDIEPFYIREMRRLKEHPGFICDDPTDTRKYKTNDYDNLFVGGKRYKVRLASSFDIEQVREYGFGELVFETTDLPFAESIGTTADIDREGLSSIQARWGVGMGLFADDGTLNYTHSGRTFRIYNAGNVAVNPFEQDLVIVVNNASKGYELRNNTTGDTFKVTEDIAQGELFIVKGVVTVNGLQALRATNKQFITLAPGWNDFTQNQARKVEFVFRFYYK